MDYLKFMRRIINAINERDYEELEKLEHLNPTRFGEIVDYYIVASARVTISLLEDQIESEV